MHSLSRHVLVLCIIFCLSFSVSLHAEPVALDPNAECQAEQGESITYEFDYRIVVTAPYHTKRLQVWLPVPPSNTVQQYELLSSETFPQSVEAQEGTEPKYGNRFAYFEFQNPTGAQIIHRRFRVTTHELNWHIIESDIPAVDQWPSSFDPYLRSDASVEVTDELRAQLSVFLPQQSNTYRDLTTVIHWVEDNLKYDHARASLQASSTHALQERSGHCSDFHGLCSAFGRALGYPTRVTYGLAGFDKHSPTHCKLEAFVPGYGWVSYDVSETQKLVKQILADEQLDEKEKRRLIDKAHERLRSGFRDNTWIKQTVGTDYELVPPASQPVKLVRTIYAEADGVPLPEPDPADPANHEFSWMTAHSVKASREVEYPFKDIQRLRRELAEAAESN